MRTTVRLNDHLLDRARREARKRKTTLTALIERGLELVLAGKLQAGVRARVALPVCREGGGTLAGVVIDDSGALIDEMERES